jgi:DNA-directed RNA polymerase specialized sigma24 family protein
VSEAFATAFRRRDRFDGRAEASAAVLLPAWGEMSYAEIAVTLGLPAGTVKAKIHRSRAKLRKALPQEATDE